MAITTEPTTDGTLPRWDLTPFYPALESREFAAAHEGVRAGVARLTALYDAHDVREGGPVEIDAERIAAFEAVIAATNVLQDELRLVNAYLYGFITTDARDETAASLHSQLQAQAAPLRTLSSRFAAWVARLGAEKLVAATPVAADHAWPLFKAELAATHQMTELEEGLAAELNLTGGSAWNKLHGDVSARLIATVDGDDLAMTVVRNLAMDDDAGRRKRAFEAELAAWEGASVPLAAAMNGIKGEANALNRRRGWEDSLAPALFYNAVDRATLEAMQAAVVASFPDFRRYLRAKARLLGHGVKGLPWWDLFAPVGDPDASECSWEHAVESVRAAFASYSPALAALAERAFAERWVDAEAHDGKRGGAFCMPVRGDESRVLLNYSGTFDGVSTLAHELGHAYHNTNLADRTPLQRQTPMALAETASIFCETILVQSGLAAAGDDPARQLVLLDTDLTGATQVVVDIHSRFLFERNVFETRADHALSVRELCDFMTDAQLATYGDGLDPDALHPYMWAVKPHYYGMAYYNWPYTFGLLFGIGLYARFLADPDRFRLGYDDLLSATGLGDAASLAARFDIDVRDEAFWTASLDVIRGRITDYESISARFGERGDAR
ncbi:MAG TPA: M3 family oligoendopeptidase [Acidimicrobiales bacterium]|jgi:pepF/M3 family oligoendopeptidase|nr:M3 family oligoendopeptidase [Acidimicrobiales bacterium]